jgi:A/G-specific adenine glycosylase
MLQQTRVAQGLPYYESFVRHYPTINDLAKAKEQEVLRLWQGLGYYTRARNLHKCAKTIVSEYGGRFPESFLKLRKLPGIGDYTAAAIASISFLEPIAVVDGNVFRVLSRVFGIEKDISTPEGKKFFWNKANELIDKLRPDLYNQAIMEFGALHCTPKQPKCNDCIFGNICVARKNDLQLLLPVKSKAKKSRNRYFYYFVIASKRGIAMQKRSKKDIWQGLFDFYLVEKSRSNAIDKIIQEDLVAKKLIRKKSTPIVSKKYKHVLSHQNIHAKFVMIDSDGIRSNDLRFYSKKQMADLPKPILIQRFLEDYNIL